ncbi:Uncharacterized protein dnm_080170 [Desulfonema magnum]|uniref:Uncharacterized protein n=1 Tax=Desulfonema magnum TaxID=45655 RepID=A0A975BVF4_9BACT|nr:Uncharacterized protein dnm_080170 [Desulfonema magnum]
MGDQLSAITSCQQIEKLSGKALKRQFLQPGIRPRPKYDITHTDPEGCILTYPFRDLPDRLFCILTRGLAPGFINTPFQGFYKMFSIC